MSRKTRVELLSAVRRSYRQAGNEEKSRIIDSFIASTGYSRKHAIALLNSEPKELVHRSRPSLRRLGGEAQEALVLIWNVCDRICGKRLVPFIPEVCKNLEENGHLHLTDVARKQLLSVSAATVDRALKATRTKAGRSLSHTKRGSLVKNKVPVRTFTEWTDVKPGFLEIDTVSHSSSDAAGPFLSTLNVTDIATCWTIPIAISSKSALEVLTALEKAKEKLPFPLLGIDFDNGSEFLNEALIEWCETHKITYTRSREYKKNDQAWVEEKNRSVVRKNVGRDRYITDHALNKLGDLYDTLCLYFNFFQPCQKLLEKSRDGAKTYKKHDLARTPVARVLESPYVSKSVKSKLRAHRATLDIMELHDRLTRLKSELKEFAEDMPNPVLAAAIAQRNATHRFVAARPAATRAGMPADSSGLSRRLEELLLTLPPKTRLAAKELEHLGKREAITARLHKLVKRGIIRRVARGMYETTSNGLRKLQKPQSVTAKVRQLIAEFPPGKRFTGKDFHHLGSNLLINRILHRLSKQEIIKSVQYGVFMVQRKRVPQN